MLFLFSLFIERFFFLSIFHQNWIWEQFEYLILLKKGEWIETWELSVCVCEYHYTCHCVIYWFGVPLACFFNLWVFVMFLFMCRFFFCVFGILLLSVWFNVSMHVWLKSTAHRALFLKISIKERNYTEILLDMWLCPCS